MRCLKCGVELEGEGQSFCPDCISTMDKHPVKPGTAVVLPTRPVRKKQPPLAQANKNEELVMKLVRKLRKLRMTVMVLLMLLILSVGGLVYMILHQDTGFEIGQNYHGATETTDQTTTPETSGGGFFP